MKGYSLSIIAGMLAVGLLGSCSSEPKTGEATDAKAPATEAPVAEVGEASPDSVGTHHPQTHHPGGVMDPATHKPGESANEHMHARPFEELVADFDDPARLAWQQPKQVIRSFGPLKGKTVMDIGAGTGYFSFPLVRMGARVISADVDDRFLKLLEERKKQQLLTDDKLVTRKLPFDSPSLAPEEVDMVLLVDVYHHLEDRPAYFRKVKAGLKPGGRVVIIDFKKKDLPVGPPASMKLAPTEIQAELKAAGFERQTVDDAMLPYQYIITAYRDAKAS